MALSSSFPLTMTLLFLFLFLVHSAHSLVPANETFSLVNEGDFGDYVVEYGGWYRAKSEIFTNPFQFCFYNTTPGAYTFALRMGTTRSETLMRWVWEANRGNPVGENATFSLRQDGNLVLAEANGRIAWQSNTANKGVVGFKLLQSGNIVLYDSKGKFVWQSFDSPTDTLLVGQSLKLGGVTKLVSRASEKKNQNGAYSLVMEAYALSLYYKSPNSPKPLRYTVLATSKEGPLTSVTFNKDLTLTLRAGNHYSKTILLNKSDRNTTLSYLRLGIEGNIRAHSYELDAFERAWEMTYILFSNATGTQSECNLPRKCGNFGLCDNSKCVACPSPNGLVSWNKNCKPAVLPSCQMKDFHYYEVAGADHWMVKYNSGEAVKQDTCRMKCSKDCKCLSYFYHEETSMCWIAYDLYTLTKVKNSKHIAYIKAPN